MTKSRGRSGTTKPTNGARQDDAPFVFERAAAKWKGYVNVEQSENTRSQFEAFHRDADLVEEALSDMVARGYKVTVTCDGTPDVYKATAYAAYRGMNDEGLAVSGWAGTFWDAVAVVTFIVTIQSMCDLSQHWDDSPTKRKFTF